MKYVHKNRVDCIKKQRRYAAVYVMVGLRLFYGNNSDGPCLGCLEDHVAEVGETFLSLHFFNLSSHVVVVGGGVYIADHSESEGQFMSVHEGELTVEDIVYGVCVVYEHVVDSVAVFTDGYSLE